MKSISKFLKANEGKVLLAIFPHPDDESFVAGGLLQAAKEAGLKVNLICLSKGERGEDTVKKEELKKIRSRELDKATAILEIDELILLGYPDGNLRKTKGKWALKIKKLIDKTKPDIVITFDYSGITGHPDHIISCHEILKIIIDMKEKPVLFWRVPDEQEKKYFKNNKALKHASSPDHILNYGFTKSIKKIRAIFSHKSQLQGARFKLQILEWYLFDHKELYFKVDLRKKYHYRFVEYNI